MIYYPNFKLFLSNYGFRNSVNQPTIIALKNKKHSKNQYTMSFLIDLILHNGDLIK